MKIEWGAKSKNNFESVENGEIFSVDNNIYIKIDTIYEYNKYTGDTAIYNCVNLETGFCGYFNDNETAVPLPNAVLKIS